ncbi:TlpA family protein disulfide reductase [Actinoplanes sp. NPDC020271]|uniref:TlpA family protein disulfide reductase n=1 Tax=Actinoplanes sp. NPDC020271 TaxID=3363896 RepID=UPI003798F224
METVGITVVGVVLAAGTAAGWWRRRTDGRLRPVTTAPPPSSSSSSSERKPGVADSTVLPGVRPEQTDGMTDAAETDTIDKLDQALLERLGAEPGRVTLLQFSSAFCAPCRAVRRVSAEVAALLPEIRHVEVDAESHLDEVRLLNIWRTPTLLILDADGRVTRRATGVPTKPHLIAALADLLPA